MAIVCDSEDLERPKMYFLDGPLEGESQRATLLDAGQIPPERIAAYKEPPLGWEECEPGEPISPPNITVTDYFRVHVETRTYFYSITEGINHHKADLIERYLARTATDINAERERRLIEIEQATRADIDDSIIQEMIQSALPPYAAHQWGARPGLEIEQERQDSLNREIRRQAEAIWGIAPRDVTLPPPIQPPDCYFCPKKKLDVFFASKRLPGQDGKKRIACQECMEERKEQRIAREVRK